MPSLLEVLDRYPASVTDPVASYIRPNERTEFGRAHDFKAISTYEDFVNAIPLRTYADLSTWIERAADGFENILTQETPIGFELTSGTSKAKKLIPFTPQFRCELASALGIWMRRWKERFPGVFDGRAYWSISPRLGEGSTHGFDDDGAYFPDDVRAALGRWLVVPEQFDFISTARALLDTPDLRSVSVWSPVFLLKLDEALGTDKTWKEIWPELQVVSCWADAQASMWTDRVIERLGGEELLEPKGLLATEGVTTIPCMAGNRLATGVHFHEFIDLQTGEVVTQIESGHRYEVVLTTGAGLYRYRTGDVIESNSSGHLTFVGRTGDSSDMVGEKIDAEQVAAAFASTGTSGFVRVEPEALAYEIWSTSPGDQVLQHLRNNPHFAQALDTGQLEDVRCHSLPQDWQSQSAEFLARRNGSREGDVKLPLLERGELRELWRN